MREGLEFAIKFLKKSAARHQHYINVVYQNYPTDATSEYLRHHDQKASCLSAVKTLEKKLRSVKESPATGVEHTQPEIVPPIALGCPCVGCQDATIDACTRCVEEHQQAGA